MPHTLYPLLACSTSSSLPYIGLPLSLTLAYFAVTRHHCVIDVLARNARKSEVNSELLSGIHIVGVGHDELDTLPSMTARKGSDGDAKRTSPKGKETMMPPTPNTGDG